MTVNKDKLYTLEEAFEESVKSSETVNKDEIRRDLEADLKLLTAIPRDEDEPVDMVHDVIAPHALRRAIAAEQELKLARESIASLEHNRKLNAEEKTAAERERDELLVELENEKKVRIYHEERADKSHREIMRLRQQNAEQTEVLKWYADTINYDDEWDINDPLAMPTKPNVSVDGGKRARTILDRYKDTQP